MDRNTETPQDRLDDVAAADTATVKWFVVEHGDSISVQRHLDGLTPCSAGLATPGMRLLPSDVQDWEEGLAALVARGLVVRVETLT